MRELEERVAQLETRMRAMENLLLSAVLAANLFEDRTLREVTGFAEGQAKFAENSGDPASAEAIRELLAQLRYVSSG